MKQQIDLNADLGEGASGENELLGLVSSASIACGFHAGDPATMSATILAAQAGGVAVGAHPSLDDRKNFGRTELPVSPKEVFALVAYQVGAFHAIAHSLGVEPQHVKPHGALYNMAARDRALADAVAHAVLAVSAQLILFAPGDSALAQAGEAIKLQVAREVFADRNYQPDGSLVARTESNALLHDAEEAAARVLRMLRDGVVCAVDGSDTALQADTVCIHGDTPDAIVFAQKLRAGLASAGIAVLSPSRS
ncbi:MAG: LamB/YcsF family protein [Chthoniobacterales bacterium]|nr:LamB/YcsF family protein [Chthoniobacterales bacterium]